MMEQKTRIKKSVLDVRFIKSYPFADDYDINELKEIFDVDIVLVNQEETPKEYNHYPSYEILEL